MAYEIGVTEVGPAELPLLEVLRETIFSEYAHQTLSTMEQALDGKKNVLMLIAHLEGNPIGFKVGCEYRPGVYHSRWGGLLKDYRRMGLAKRMQDWQHQFAKSRGYKTIMFNTFNHFREMMLMGLSTGFKPVAIEWRQGESMSFRFVKSLVDAIGPVDQSTWFREKSVADTGKYIEVDHRDTSRLHYLISNGVKIFGLRYDTETNTAVVLLRYVPAIV